MESVLKSFSSSTATPFLMARRPGYTTNHHPANTPPFPPPPPSQPPLLPLPVPASWPVSEPRPPAWRGKKPRHAVPSPKRPEAPPVASTAPVLVAPAKNRAGAGGQEEDWTGSLYSVSPPPSSVPMPTSLLVAARGKVAACAVEAAGGGGVDACATDELRRLLRL